MTDPFIETPSEVFTVAHALGLTSLRASQWRDQYAIPEHWPLYSKEIGFRPGAVEKIEALLNSRTFSLRPPGISPPN